MQKKSLVDFQVAVIEQLPPLKFVERHRISLQPAQQFPVRAIALESLQQLRSFPPAHEDRALAPVGDQAELFRRGAELDLSVHRVACQERHHAVLVVVADVVVKEIEEAAAMRRAQRIVGVRDGARHSGGAGPPRGIFGHAQQPVGRGAGRVEDDHPPPVQFAFAVAAPRRLGDRVKSGHGAIDHGKIEIDAGFDQLGADHSCRPGFALQIVLDTGDDTGTVRAAH